MILFFNLKQKAEIRSVLKKYIGFHISSTTKINLIISHQKRSHNKNIFFFSEEKILKINFGNLYKKMDCFYAKTLMCDSIV